MRYPLALFALLALFFAQTGAASALPTQDVCVGNGTPGPYALSWSHVLLGTEAVRINGLTQLRGLDYILDADTGAITFSRDLPAQSAAEVTYERDAVLSQRNGAGQAIPLSLDLLRGQHGYFALNALGKYGDNTQSGLTLGMGMGLSGGPNTQLSTRFFIRRWPRGQIPKINPRRNAWDWQWRGQQARGIGDYFHSASRGPGPIWAM